MLELGKLIPRIPVLVLTNGKKLNIAPISWFTGFSNSWVGISVRKRTLTHENIQLKQRFNVAIPDVSWLKIIMQTGNKSGKEILESKFDLFNIPYELDEEGIPIVKCPLVLRVAGKDSWEVEDEFVLHIGVVEEVLHFENGEKVVLDKVGLAKFVFPLKKYSLPVTCREAGYVRTGEKV